MARVKINLPTTKIFTCQIQVTISHINYGNHVGNDAMVSILHEARVQWLTALKLSELNVGGASLIMADLMVAYKAEAFYGDTLMVDVYLGETNPINFELYYKITASRNEQNILIALAKTGMVYYDYDLKKITTAPLAFASILTN